MKKIRVTPNGIKRHLKRYQPKHAFAEFIWNGFDAGASKVEIVFEKNEIGHIFSLQITDNGQGITHSKLDSKFRPFLESEKEADPNAPRVTSTVHGKNGVGRLTFFTFANQAKWNTICKENGKNCNYEISISREKLDDYDPTKPVETEDETGTTVFFEGIYGITSRILETDIHQYLSKEFGWYLELHVGRKALFINETPFNYSDMIGERDNLSFVINEENFELRYVRWSQKLNDEYSRFYLIDSNGNERFTDTTTLNNKGDQFFHSLYIKSSFFDDFKFSETSPLFRDTHKGKTYRELMVAIDGFLKEKRKPFLKDNVDKVIDELENNDAFPSFGENAWDKIKEGSLKEFIGELYQVEPKIFTNLNVEQKKTFVRLLNLVMDTGERDALLDIIAQIVKLTSAERQQLANTLRVTSLSNILKTIKLIEDRFAVVADLKQLVFDKDLQAKEIPHLQTAIEAHYWIFGEQYHLVTAAEPKFEVALRRFVYHLRKEKTTTKIKHPDKLKEMDIFMVRQQMIDKDKKISCVCVELKHPKVNLGEKELNKLKKYYSVISQQPEFNGENYLWEFYLVGNKFDSTKYIENEIQNAQHHGENSLVYFVGKHKIYVRKWSEIFADFELRHNFLLDKLKLERDKLGSDSQTADEVIQELSASTAVRPAQIVVPS